jgi:1,4-dihydroxy-2-naphthoate octaprenyltransferase
MFQPKKPRSSKSLWLLSIALIAIGIVLTINLSMIRPVGFVLLGIGGIGMIRSLTNKEGWDDDEDKKNPRSFN